MEFQHQNNRITMSDGSQEVGFISYMENGDILTIDHTEVSPDFSGQGMGKQLVAQLVEYARNHRKSLDPECPYAKKVIEETSEYHDVLAN